MKINQLLSFKIAALFGTCTVLALPAVAAVSYPGNHGGDAKAEQTYTITEGRVYLGTAEGVKDLIFIDLDAKPVGGGDEVVWRGRLDQKTGELTREEEGHSKTEIKIGDISEGKVFHSDRNHKVYIDLKMSLTPEGRKANSLKSGGSGEFQGTDTVIWNISMPEAVPAPTQDDDAE